MIRILTEQYAMGCDIHPYLCFRTSSGDVKPVKYSKLDLGRDYTFFGLLAGVRGEHTLFEARGFPTNTPSHITFNYNSMEGDAHHASWLTTSEVQAIAEAYVKINNWQNPLLAGLVGMMQSLDAWCNDHEPGTHVELIFFFDC